MKGTSENPIVLVVDDNPKNLQIIALTLRDLNYRLIIADNGKKAIDLSGRHKIDLILLDIMMPGIDGFEVCKVIKSNPQYQNIPIIFLTALSEKTNLVKGFELGAVDYITKPFNKEELISRIKTHLELKFARDELQKATNHLTELNAIKDKMFSVIGHDLRSPIGSLKMTLDMLANSIERYDTNRLKETIASLSKTSEEVFGLLENLLWWARSQNGNLTIHTENIALADFVSSLFYLNKSSLLLKDIQFEKNIADDTKVFADHNILKTVLHNLLTNAIKFTPNGGTVSISSELEDNRIKIRVSDTGIGIPEENIPKLFDEKQFFTTPGTSNESGSGLGLLLCKKFVQASQGEIRVESRQGKGSTFTIEIPAGKDEEIREDSFIKQSE